VIQAAIFVLSPVALWLLASRSPSRWGWIVGLVAQPFWLYATWSEAQWGMFSSALLYTLIYARGLRNHWRHHG
jgi:hypothetical protein